MRVGGSRVQCRRPPARAPEVGRLVADIRPGAAVFVSGRPVLGPGPANWLRTHTNRHAAGYYERGAAALPAALTQCRLVRAYSGGLAGDSAQRANTGHRCLAAGRRPAAAWYRVELATCRFQHAFHARRSAYHHIIERTGDDRDTCFGGQLAVPRRYVPH